jgi:chromosome segregation ATPase
MLVLHTLILVSMVVFVVSVATGLVVVCMRALALWRSFRRFRRAIDRELSRLTARLAQTERELERAGEGVREANDARVRLQASLAAAAALLRGAGEAWSLVARMRALRPAK